MLILVNQTESFPLARLFLGATNTLTLIEFRGAEGWAVHQEIVGPLAIPVLYIYTKLDPLLSLPVNLQFSSVKSTISSVGQDIPFLHESGDEEALEALVATSDMMVSRTGRTKWWSFRAAD